MQSFDERGGGRRVAANMLDSYQDYDDFDGAGEDLGDGGQYRANEAQNVPAGRGQQEEIDETEAPKVQIRAMLCPRGVPTMNAE